MRYSLVVFCFLLAFQTSAYASRPRSLRTIAARTPPGVTVRVTTRPGQLKDVVAPGNWIVSERLSNGQKQPVRGTMGRKNIRYSLPVGSYSADIPGSPTFLFKVERFDAVPADVLFAQNTSKAVRARKTTGAVFLEGRALRVLHIAADGRETEVRLSEYLNGRQGAELRPGKYKIIRGFAQRTGEPVTNQLLVRK